jgi:hypothetical protein
MADGITRIAVEGFKSIAKRQEIEIRPLTILAGANSSGKSSIMQPLLMLKQTLEATYDPGPLLISDGHLNFASTDQFLSKTTGNRSPQKLTIGIAVEGAEFQVVLQKRDAGMQLLEQRAERGDGVSTLRPNMSGSEIAFELGLPELQKLQNLSVVRNRFFLAIESLEMPRASVAEWVTPVVRNILHVPSLRGTRSRVYKTAAVEGTFQGPFDTYAASVIFLWQSQNNPSYEALIGDLKMLGLAKNLLAKKLNDRDLQLLVNRAESPNDLIDIADVGLGVSQVLPVLVALRLAEFGSARVPRRTRDPSSSARANEPRRHPCRCRQTWGPRRRRNP